MNVAQRTELKNELRHSAGNDVLRANPRREKRRAYRRVCGQHRAGVHLGVASPRRRSKETRHLSVLSSNEQVREWRACCIENEIPVAQAPG